MTVDLDELIPPKPKLPANYYEPDADGWQPIIAAPDGIIDAGYTTWRTRPDGSIEYGGRTGMMPGEGEPMTRNKEARIDGYGKAPGDLIPTWLVRDEYVGHFFDAATMRFFGSRVAEYGYRGIDGAVYFVTSERDTFPAGAWNNERRYTVRRWHPAEPDRIDEPAGTGFGQYRSRQVAAKAAERIARTGSADLRRKATVTA